MKKFLKFISFAIVLFAVFIIQPDVSAGKDTIDADTIVNSLTDNKPNAADADADAADADAASTGIGSDDTDTDPSSNGIRDIIDANTILDSATDNKPDAVEVAPDSRADAASTGVGSDDTDTEHHGGRVRRDTSNQTMPSYITISNDDKPEAVYNKILTLDDHLTENTIWPAQYRPTSKCGSDSNKLEAKYNMRLVNLGFSEKKENMSFSVGFVTNHVKNIEKNTEYSLLENNCKITKHNPGRVLKVSHSLKTGKLRFVYTRTYLHGNFSRFLSPTDTKNDDKFNPNVSGIVIANLYHSNRLRNFEFLDTNNFNSLGVTSNFLATDKDLIKTQEQPNGGNLMLFTPGTIFSKGDGTNRELYYIPFCYAIGNKATHINSYGVPERSTDDIYPGAIFQCRYIFVDNTRSSNRMSNPGMTKINKTLDDLKQFWGLSRYPFFNTLDHTDNLVSGIVAVCATPDFNRFACTNWYPKSRGLSVITKNDEVVALSTTLDATKLNGTVTASGFLGDTITAYVYDFTFRSNTFEVTGYVPQLVVERTGGEFLFLATYTHSSDPAPFISIDSVVHGVNLSLPMKKLPVGAVLTNNRVDASRSDLGYPGHFVGKKNFPEGFGAEVTLLFHQYNYRYTMQVRNSGTVQTPEDTTKTLKKPAWGIVNDFSNSTTNPVIQFNSQKTGNIIHLYDGLISGGKNFEPMLDSDELLFVDGLPKVEYFAVKGVEAWKTKFVPKVDSKYNDRYSWTTPIANKFPNLENTFWQGKAYSAEYLLPITWLYTADAYVKSGDRKMINPPLVTEILDNNMGIVNKESFYGEVGEANNYPSNMRIELDGKPLWQVNMITKAPVTEFYPGIDSFYSSLLPDYNAPPSRGGNVHFFMPLFEAKSEMLDEKKEHVVEPTAWYTIYGGYSLKYINGDWKNDFENDIGSNFYDFGPNTQKIHYINAPYTSKTQYHNAKIVIDKNDSAVSLSLAPLHVNSNSINDDTWWTTLHGNPHALFTTNSENINHAFGIHMEIKLDKRSVYHGVVATYKRCKTCDEVITNGRSIRPLELRFFGVPKRSQVASNTPPFVELNEGVGIGQGRFMDNIYTVPEQDYNDEKAKPLIPTLTEALIKSGSSSDGSTFIAPKYLRNYTFSIEREADIPRGFKGWQNDGKSYLFKNILFKVSDADPSMIRNGETDYYLSERLQAEKFFLETADGSVRVSRLHHGDRESWGGYIDFRLGVDSSSYADGIFDGPNNYYLSWVKLSFPGFCNERGEHCFHSLQSNYDEIMFGYDDVIKLKNYIRSKIVTRSTKSELAPFFLELTALYLSPFDSDIVGGISHRLAFIHPHMYQTPQGRSATPGKEDQKRDAGPRYVEDTYPIRFGAGPIVAMPMPEKIYDIIRELEPHGKEVLGGSYKDFTILSYGDTVLSEIKYADGPRPKFPNRWADANDFPELYRWDLFSADDWILYLRRDRGINILTSCEPVNVSFARTAVWHYNPFPVLSEVYELSRDGVIDISKTLPNDLDTELQRLVGKSQPTALPNSFLGYELRFPWISIVTAPYDAICPSAANSIVQIRQRVRSEIKGIVYYPRLKEDLSRILSYGIPANNTAENFDNDIFDIGPTYKRDKATLDKVNKRKIFTNIARKIYTGQWLILAKAPKDLMNDIGNGKVRIRVSMYDKQPVNAKGSHINYQGAPEILTECDYRRINCIILAPGDGGNNSRQKYDFTSRLFE